MKDDRELVFVITRDNKKLVTRWLREQDGVKYVLYKSSIWKVKKSHSVFNAWELDRPVLFS